MYVHIPGSTKQRRTITSDWAAADDTYCIIIEGSYLYALHHDSGAPALQLWRYDKTNIAAGGTLMTMSGQTFGTTSITQVRMVSNGSGTFYFTCKAGNSASNHIVSKYTISGTTATYVSDVTCGSTAGNLQEIVGVNSNGDIIGYARGGDDFMRRYNSSGTLQATSVVYGSEGKLYKVAGTHYIGAQGAVTLTLFSQIDLP